MSFEVQEQGAILAPVLEEGLEVLCICWVIDRSNFAEFWLTLELVLLFCKGNHPLSHQVGANFADSFG